MKDGPPGTKGRAMTDVKIFEGFRALRRASPDRRRREGKESAERQKGEKGWKNSRITGFFEFFSAKKRKSSDVYVTNLGTLRVKVRNFLARDAVVLFILQPSEALFSGILEKQCGGLRQEMVRNRASEYQTVGWISPKIIIIFEGMPSGETGIKRRELLILKWQNRVKNRKVWYKCQKET